MFKFKYISIYKGIFCILSYISLVTSANAQSFGFKDYSIEDGLSQSQVMAMHQDSKGFFWLGTNGGLSRFDGKNFKNFYHKDGLGNNIVWTIYEDNSHNLWFGTDATGLTFYDYLEFKRLPILNKISQFTFYGIDQDCENNYYFGGDNGLYKYTPDSITGGSLIKCDDKQGNLNEGILHLIIDEACNLWIGTIDGLYKAKFDGSSNILNTMNYANYIDSSAVYFIFKDKEKRIWVGTNNGVYVLNGSSALNLNVENGLCNKYVNRITQDRKGRIWVATEEGVSRIEVIDIEKAEFKFTNFTKKNGFHIGHVSDILEDTEKNIWFGINGGGISMYKEFPFSNYKGEELNSNTIWSIIQDDKGDIWVGTEGSGPMIFSGNNFRNPPVSEKLTVSSMSLLQDQNKNIWVGSDGFGLYFLQRIGDRYADKYVKYVMQDGLAEDVIITMHEDSKGNIWIGYLQEGINVLELKDSKITNIKHFSTDNGLVNNSVSHIVEDKEGNIWIGTDGGGTSVFDGEKFYHVTVKDGLGGKYVLSLLIDKNGYIWMTNYGAGLSVLKNPSAVFKNGKLEWDYITTMDGLNDDHILFIETDDLDQLWIGTNRGVNKMDMKAYYATGEKNIKTYGKEEGFLAIEADHNAVCKDQSGNIWFGTIAGLIKYNPKRDRVNMIESSTNIIGHRIFLKDTLLKNNVILKYDQNHITFDFIGICYTNAEKVKYKYILDGFDNEWSPITKETSATYSNLPAGEFTFKVISSNNEGIWNSKSTTYHFSIMPPYWKTWWFTLLYVIAIIAAIMSLMKYKVRSIEQKRRILEYEVHKRTQELSLEKEKVETINQEISRLAKFPDENLNPVLRISDKGQVLYANFASNPLLQLWNCKKGDVLSDEWKKEFAEVFEKARYKEYEVVNNGTIYSLVFTPIREEDYVNVYGRDITDKKKAEQEIVKKNAELNKKNDHILDSISYARRIQDAILPSEDDILNAFPESFVINKPKEIVSGDFYWYTKLDRDDSQSYIVALCDCTGHGVPGAFISLIGNDLLKEAVMEKKLIDPGLILDELHKGVNSALHSGNINLETRDGMDASICTIEPGKNMLQYSGANRPLYIVDHERNLHEIKPNKYGIAEDVGERSNYATHIINIHSGDTIYMFSDGITDQFGGPNEKKYMAKRFKELLLDFNDMEMSKQAAYLEKEFTNWKGKNEQTDDVTVIGIRIT